MARGRPHVRADADRRHPGRPAVVRARHRSGLEVGRCGVRRRTSGRGSAAHPGRRCRGRLGAARRGGSGGGLRGPRSALDRPRVLRARLRAAGACAVRRGRGVDRGDGAVVPDERHREPPWALPRAPRGDPEVARGVRRSGARGAGGLRGAEAVPAPRDGMAAQRARKDPAAQGRHRRRGGGPLGSASRWVGGPTGARAGAPGARRGGRGGRRHTRRAGRIPRGFLRRSCHRTPTCSGRRCSTRRSRSRSRAATSAAPGRLPTSWSAWPPDFRARRWWPGRPWRGDGCGSRRATRRRRSGVARKPHECGTRSGRPMRRRSHGWFSQRHPRRRPRGPRRSRATGRPYDPRPDRSCVECDDRDERLPP